jgi:M6 family metalloprotease-like protein
MARRHDRSIPSTIAVFLSVIMFTAGAEPLMAQNYGAGSLSVYAPPEAAPVNARLGVWTPIPGLSTGVASVDGDNLEITVSAEMYQPGGTVWFRALVDGKVAQPSDVAFKAGSENFDGVRSFTFVQPGVDVGQHLVEIQWFSGSTVSIRDRTLSVHSGSPSNGPNRLAVAAGTSGPDLVKNTAFYEDIPGLSTTVTTNAGTLAVVFSAEGGADSGRMLVRALVDNASIGEAVFSESGNGGRQGTRSYTFVATELRAGAHNVRLQWEAVSGTSRIGDRTMAVSVAETSSQQTAGPSATLFTATQGWVDVPGGSASFFALDNVNTAAFTFSGEVMADPGRLFLRVLVDGQPASPGDVTLIQGGPKWRATSHVFIVKNLDAGLHNIRFQAMADPSTRAQIRNSTARALWKWRSGSDFVQPFGGMAPLQRRIRALVICFDPLRPAETRPGFGQVKAVFGDNDPVIGRLDVVAGREASEQTAAVSALPIFKLPGLDSGPNFRDWLAENSGGPASLVNTRYAGCNDGAWYLAPPERRGNWYWDNSAFDQMWKDALHAADADVNFHDYDTDHNNVLTPDELLVAIVRPQNSPYGTVRGTTQTVDGNPTPMGFTVVDLYLSSLSANHLWNVGLAAHEGSHAIIGALDIYGVCPQVSPGYYSVMDQHYLSTHLDAFHKMKNGMVQPVAVDLSKNPPGSFALQAVEERNQILLLYHPDRVGREYFLIENRYPGGSFKNYDGPLGTGAIVVWQIFEDKTLTANSAVCPGDVRFIRRRAVLSSVGQGFDLAWGDGASAGYRVTASIPNAELGQITLTPIP